MALRMMKSLCGEDPQKWNEAIEAAQEGLQKRIALWDAIQKRLTNPVLQ
jgi:hypothetical protein